MEFKEYIGLFRKEKKVFWMTALAVVFIGIVWQVSQKDIFVGNLTLNITRAGSEKTDDYQYHDFYRLQADERFADTVVRWLQSPRIVADIYEDAYLSPGDFDMRSLPRLLKAERLSSQMIQVTYKATDEISVQDLSQSIIDRLNQETKRLNADQQETAWFVIQGDDPVIYDGRTGMLITFFIAAVLGIFFGFWAVLLKRYFE